jgi:hypothetical protein
LKIYSSKSRFSLQIVQTPNCQGPDVQVRNSVYDQGLNATADGGVSSSRSRRGPDDPTDTKVSKSPFAQGPDKNAMIADEERVFMHSSGH